MAMICRAESTMSARLYHYRANVVDVYDGDTITCNIDLGMGVWLSKQKIRLWGINAPELKGETREAGIGARDHLQKLIMAPGAVLPAMIILETRKDRRGKYGRWLGIVWAGEKYEMDVNTVMVADGHAKAAEY